MSIKINATMREDQGKGASRRLRRQEQVPAIVYGADKAPNTVALNLHEITYLLENEETYTSVLDLIIDKQTEQVIIKDLQRHPAKNFVVHVDFLRIDMKKEIVTSVPLHFIGEENNEAMRVGAILNQFITAIEISCLPSDLPHAIEVDISQLMMDQHISLTELIVPAGVTITALMHGDIEAHDQSVVAVQEPRLMAEEVEETAESEVEKDAEDTEGIEGIEDNVEDTSDKS